MNDIDQCIAAVASFSGLHCFPEGQGFKQWTGNDSKALMKNVITESMLSNIEDAIDRFHHYHEIFKMTGIVSTLLLPCQHAIKHYSELIWLFGAPNGLCSSITENKHITAYKVLGQMLITNQHLDKLSAVQTDFNHHGAQSDSQLRATGWLTFNLNPKAQMAPPAASTGMDSRGSLADVAADNEDEEADHSMTVLAVHVELSQKPYVPYVELPFYNGAVSIFNSASSRFYASSDLSGTGGMHKEYI
ncbi:hypothetical protein HD554DRAFT_2040528 [Boletus coccyginus]|nr:hypothetical protein HD554DRAFT_2040528 [Boletus coccyginus]